jgi:hypothetical protein
MSSCSSETESSPNTNSGNNSTNNSTPTFDPKDFCKINDLDIEEFSFVNGRIYIEITNNSSCTAKFIKVEFSITRGTNVIDTNDFFAVGSAGLKAGYTIEDDFYTDDDWFYCRKWQYGGLGISNSCTENNKTGTVEIVSVRFE